MNCNHRIYFLFLFTLSIFSGNSQSTSTKFISPLDWAASKIEVGKSTFLKFGAISVKKGSSYVMCFTSATDVREEKTIEVALADTGEKLAVCRVDFAHLFQPFEIEFTASQLKKINISGLALTITKGEKPFYFFVSDTIIRSNLAYLPHVNVKKSTSKVQNWKLRLKTLESIQTFGWMEGCVLDGLLAMYKTTHEPDYLQAIKLHLAQFIKNKELVYDGRLNHRLINQIESVETILPFAISMQIDANKKLQNKVIDFCLKHANEHGVIADGKGNNRTLKTEECYTVAYPLSVIAMQKRDTVLMNLAIKTLDSRIELLSKNGSVYQNGTESGTLNYRGWARGLAWYMLGLSKTIEMMEGYCNTDKYKCEFQKVANYVISQQQDNGLWSCFIEDKVTGVETSGSVGIAAALAFGSQKGYLNIKAKNSATRCFNALQSYFTSDGYLTGTSQVNKGGELLQRNGFRVISPYTLGLYAQLHCYLINSIK